MKSKNFCFQEQTSDKLNTLLDTVYEMNDTSMGVSDDLERLISSTVQQVEEITDKIQDALKEVFELFEEAKTNENAWRKPETYPTSEEFRKIQVDRWGAKRRAYGKVYEILESLK